MDKEKFKKNIYLGVLINYNINDKMKIVDELADLFETELDKTRTDLASEIKFFLKAAIYTGADCNMIGKNDTKVLNKRLCTIIDKNKPEETTYNG